jgi:hypothetical protein
MQLELVEGTELIQQGSEMSIRLSYSAKREKLLLDSARFNRISSERRAAPSLPLPHPRLPLVVTRGSTTRLVHLLYTLSYTM